MIYLYLHICLSIIYLYLPRMYLPTYLYLKQGFTVEADLILTAILLSQLPECWIHQPLHMGDGVGGIFSTRSLGGLETTEVGQSFNPVASMASGVALTHAGCSPRPVCPTPV